MALSKQWVIVDEPLEVFHLFLILLQQVFELLNFSWNVNVSCVKLLKVLIGQLLDFVLL